MLRLAALLVLLLGPAIAEAKTYKLGEPAVAEVTIPDAWQVEASDGTVEALAPDASKDKSATPGASAYLSAEIFDTADIGEAGQTTAQFIKDQKIKVDPKSQAKAQRKVAGLEASDVSWNATDEDGPTRLRISLVKVKPNKMLLLTYWRSEAGEKAHAGEIDAIETSLKPLK